jgi:hypothetical protein
MIRCPYCNTILPIRTDHLAGCVKCTKVFEVVVVEREKNPSKEEKLTP